MGKGYHFWGHLEIPLTKNPDPSRSNRIFRVPIPSEKNRNVGVIRNPFIRTYLDP